MLGPFRIIPPADKDEKKSLFRRLPSVSTPEEFERTQINERALSKQYTISINDEQNQFLEFVIEDGIRQKHTTQIITQGFTIASCTCKDFATNKLGYCEHIAIPWLMTYRILTSNMGLLSAFHVRIRKLQGTLKYFNGQRLNVWHPEKDTFITIGTKGEPINTVGVGNIVSENDLVEQYNKRYNELKEKNVNSDGLLRHKKLYDYQEDIFLKMLAAKRSICSMIQGSGKTITSIAVYEWYRKNVKPDAKLLIIAPKSLKMQWSEEVLNEIGLDVFQIDKEDDIDEFVDSEEQIGAVTYQLIARYPETFSEMYFDMIILDEMQYVKNNETKAWKAMSKLKFEYALGLSGTIIENRINDLYAVMNILQPGYLGPEWKFNANYQVLQNITKRVIHYRGTKNIDKLQERLKPVVFSYNKLKLETITHTNHMVKLSPKERNLHDENMAQANILMAKAMNAPLSFAEKAILQSYLLKARQATNTKQLLVKTEKGITSGKLDKLVEIVNEKLAEKKKIVIFSSWVEMLDIIAEHITKRCGKPGYVFFTGKQNPRQRNAAVRSFQKDKQCKIFLASDAGGLGVDGLQYAATVIIHTELPWNPAKLDQRNARLHRIGQDKEVEVHYLIGEESIETSIMSTLYDKRAIRQEVLYEEAKPKKVIEPFVAPKKEATKIAKKFVKSLTVMF